jgi:hypothetical protein
VRLASSEQSGSDTIPYPEEEDDDSIEDTVFIPAKRERRLPKRLEDYDMMT